MAGITDTASQYRDSSKFEARTRLFRKYGQGGTPWFPRVAKLAAMTSGDAVLDLGCGPGGFWSGAADEVPDGLTIELADTSPGMIAEARATLARLRRWPAVGGTVADAVALPFATGRFDRVLALHMLYHTSDPERAVAEVARVLKPQGRVLISLNGRGHMQPLAAISHEVFGGPAIDPSAEAFGIEQAEPVLRRHFRSVRLHRFSASLDCTDPEDVVANLTSFPPGETADAAQLVALRAAIARRLDGTGTLRITTESGVFVCADERD